MSATFSKVAGFSTPPWVFFSLYKWYQITQSVTFAYFQKYPLFVKDSHEFSLFEKGNGNRYNTNKINITIESFRKIIGRIPN